MNKHRTLKETNKTVRKGHSPIDYLWSAVAASLLAAGLVVPSPTEAQGLPSSNAAPGTILSRIEGHGGRVTTFHRGYLYLAGEETTTLWDISNIQQPQLVHRLVDAQGNDLVANGHTWWKVESGDLFYRQYASPEAELHDCRYQYLDISNMLDRDCWTRSTNFYYQSWAYAAQAMATYPLQFSTAGIRDIRRPHGTSLLTNTNIWNLSGISAVNLWRLGNWVMMSPSDSTTGLAILDVSGLLSDNQQPRLLGVMGGNIRQYTNSWHIWENYVVLAAGADNNGPNSNANVLVIDVEDPTNPHIVRTHTTAQMPGRYVHFQDEYAFAGHAGTARKMDMRNGNIVQTFTPPSGARWGDFQWIPYGNILMNSSSEVTGPTPHEHTTFMTHQSAADTRAPYVGFHVPSAGATNLYRDSVIGLVINETLDDTTINDQSFQVRPVVNGVVQAPIAGVVMSSQYDVINFFPVNLLEANRTYQVRLVANGIRDISGNGIADYRFCFSTGNQIDPGCTGGSVSSSSSVSSVSSSSSVFTSSSSSVSSSSAVSSSSSSSSSLVQNQPPVIHSLEFGPAENLTVGTPANFTATATDPNPGDTLLYRFNFGDGTPQTNYSTSNSQTHTFSEPGNYLVVVQVNDGSTTLSRSLNVSVSATANFPEDTSRTSSELYLDQERNKLWTVNPDNNSISVIDTQSLTLLQEIATDPHPASVAGDSFGRVWVAHRDADRIRLYFAGNHNLTQTINLPWGTAPTALVIDPTRNWTYVAASGSNRLLRFNSGNLSAGGELVLPEGTRIHSLAIDADGEFLYAARFISPQTQGQIFKINLNNFSLSTTITLPMDTTSGDSGVSARGIPNYVSGLRINPLDASLWYSGKKDNVLRGLTRDGQGLTHESTVRGLIGRVDTATNSESVNRRVDIDNHSLVTDVAFSPNGNLGFAIMQANNRVVVFDTGDGREISRLDLGMAPAKLTLDANNGRLYVNNFLSRSVSVVDISHILATGAGEMQLLEEIDTVTDELLSPQVLLGKQVFYNAEDTRMASEGYLSCAVCHIDGDQDGRVWDFTQLGEGLRNTTSLKGAAGMSNGPVHWSGNFDEIQDFEIPIRALFGGTGFISNSDFNGAHGPALGAPKAGLSADLDALAAYVASLNSVGHSPHKNSDGTLSSAALAGREIFRQRNCQSCHAGDNFTDSSMDLRHDVGTLTLASGMRLNELLDGLDTPSLKGLWKSAPYLHDGSAATLETVLTHPDNNAHGKMAGLSAQERSSLIAYLLQIDDAEENVPANISSSSSAASQSSLSSTGATSSSSAQSSSNASNSSISSTSSSSSSSSLAASVSSAASSVSSQVNNNAANSSSNAPGEDTRAGTTTWLLLLLMLGLFLRRYN